MSPKGPLTVETGRAMQARARRYMVVERVGVIVAGLAIPLFLVSYLELRRIDVAVLGGAERTIPYLAYTAIAMFIGGFVLIKVARHAIATISRALEAEQKRRVLDDDEPFGRDTGAPGCATPATTNVHASETDPALRAGH